MGSIESKKKSTIKNFNQCNMNIFIFGTPKNNSRMCGSNKKRKITGKKTR